MNQKNLSLRSKKRLGGLSLLVFLKDETCQLEDLGLTETDLFFWFRSGARDRAGGGLPWLW